MKKLITILFLILTFNVNAQIQLAEDWTFKQDKQYHTYGGVVITGTTFTVVYKNTKNEAWARHVAIFTGISAGFVKEFADGINGKEIMLSDFTYTAVSSIATGYLLWGVKKYKKKRKKRKNAKILESNYWSLDNEFINNM